MVYCCIPFRYILVGLISVGWFNVLLLRTNVSTALVFMVNYSAISENDSARGLNEECPGSNETSEQYFESGPFRWNTVQQGLVLGCYYYGYVVSGVPGAWIAKRVGFKHVVGISVIISSILTIVSPLAALKSIELFVLCRLLIGLFQGSVISVSISSFSIWIPPKERNVAFSIAMCGYLFGAFATLPLATIIAKYISWEAVFYITGSFTILWSIIWFVLVYNSPSEHPFISDEEKAHIQKHVPNVKKEKKIDIPWMSMLKSMPLWAALLSHFAYDWMFATAGLLLPTYMSTIVKLDVTAAGLWSGFPNLIMIAVVLLSSALVEKVGTQKNLTVIRKIYILLALLVPSIFTLLASYAGCNQMIVILCFLISMSFLGFHVNGTEANYLDLSPLHCGIIFGISSLLCSTAGFIAPQVVGFMLYENNSTAGWRKFFWISAGINLFSGLLYLFFGSAKEQNWSKLKTDEYILGKNMSFTKSDMSSLERLNDEKETKTT